jgi:TRAP-type C4-dicarboxylate transport system substrate-binding protein
MPGRSGARLALLAGALIVLSGCGSGAADKTGGSQPPVVLTLGDSNNSDQPDTSNIEHFAREVARRSHGSLRVRIVYLAAGSDSAQVEKETIERVEAGRYDLGWVGSRAWDEVGVTSFRALQAPFLISSTRLLDRVLQSPIAPEMLAALGRQKLVGLALVPDYLRHPVGMRHQLTAPADFVGRRIRIQPSRVSAAVIRALRAIPLGIGNNAIGYAIGSGRVDGQELSLLNSPSGVIVTGNVVLFPKALTLFGRRDVLDRLSGEQRAALRVAAAELVRHAVTHNITDSFAARHFCFEGRRIVLATPGQRVALEREERPVYAWLEQDAQTRRFIARIRALKKMTPPDPPLVLPAACRRPPETQRAVGPRRSSSLLDGTYRWVITLAEAKATGNGPHPGDVFPMISTAVLKDGVWKVSGSGHDGGTYTIRGRTVTFDWPRVASVLVFRFAREANGTIHWTPVLPMDPGDQFVWASQPWRRIGPPGPIPQ